MKKVRNIILCFTLLAFVFTLSSCNMFGSKSGSSTASSRSEKESSLDIEDLGMNCFSQKCK